MKKTVSPEVKENYKKLMRRVSRMQNGDISKILRKMGIAYRLNYGVSIPHLRQLIPDIKPNNELAFLLWNRNIRETKILSSMLFEIDSLTKEQALEIGSKVNNQELIEQFSRNLFARMPFVLELIESWIKGSLAEITLAFYTAGWNARQETGFSEPIKDWAFKHIKESAAIDNNQLHQSISFVMQCISHLSEENRQAMKILAENMMHTEKNSVRRLGEEYLWINTQ